MSTVNDNVRTTLENVANSLPFTTEERAKIDAQIDSIVANINATHDAMSEVPSRVRMFARQAVTTAQRVASDTQKFSDVDAKVVSTVASALEDYATLQGVSAADFSFAPPRFNASAS